MTLSVNGQTLYPPAPAAGAGEPALAASSGFTVDPKGNISINIATTSAAKPGGYQVTLQGMAESPVNQPIYTLAAGKPVRPAGTDPDTAVITVTAPQTLRPGAFYHLFLPGMMKPRP